jgi:hypothetical protein
MSGKKQRRQKMTFEQAYCKTHMQQFKTETRSGRFTHLYHEDRGYYTMKRMVMRRFVK